MTYCIEVSYPFMPSVPDEEIFVSTIEEAAQVFESKAEVPAAYSLSQIVEDLSTDGELEYENPEDQRLVTVRKIPVGVGV